MHAAFVFFLFLMQDPTSLEAVALPPPGLQLPNALLAAVGS